MEHFNTDCLMGIAWKLKAPVIGLSSCSLLPWLYDRVGTPYIPSVMPSFFNDHYGRTTFFQRLTGFVNMYSGKWLHW